jgi:hypothetical protein
VQKQKHADPLRLDTGFKLREEKATSLAGLGSFRDWVAKPTVIERLMVSDGRAAAGPF